MSKPKIVNLHNKLVKRYGEAYIIRITPEEMRMYKMNVGDRVEKVELKFVEDGE